MQINIITCVPCYFVSVLSSSILARAINQQLVKVEVIDLRHFADGKRKKIVDDRPYGGGAGQVLKIEPIVRAVEYLQAQKCAGKIYLTSPGGQLFKQSQARRWSTKQYLTFICGHYEGVDERVKNFIDGEISLGEFILTGGEPVVAAVIDAIVRLIPGVLGNPESLKEESFNANCLEYPQYTRPAVWRGLRVPEILLSGHQAKIAAWRQCQSRLLPPKTNKPTNKDNQ